MVGFAGLVEEEATIVDADGVVVACHTVVGIGSTLEQVVDLLGLCRLHSREVVLPSVSIAPGSTPLVPPHALRVPLM